MYFYIWKTSAMLLPNSHTMITRKSGQMEHASTRKIPQERQHHLILCTPGSCLHRSAPANALVDRISMIQTWRRNYLYGIPPDHNNGDADFIQWLTPVRSFRPRSQFRKSNQDRLQVFLVSFIFFEEHVSYVGHRSVQSGFGVFVDV